MSAAMEYTWTEIALIGIAALALSALVTRLVRRLALAHGVLDIPNSRSSHTTATPRGGGIAIVVTATAGTILLAFLGPLPTDMVLAASGGGIAVAGIGFLDDRFSVPPGIRFAVHVTAAIWAVVCLGGLPPVRIGAHVVQLGWAGEVLAVLGIVWTLNLFNFMDGIDGIAASEAVFITGSGALLTLLGAGSPGVLAAALVFSAACSGFLLWNWPPAKIFMGDVGSGYVGYVIAVLALTATRVNPNAIWVWLILGGAFFVDATVTLVRRVLRGERVHEAHRSHAYQWLARKWGSHRPVTVSVLMLNLMWLLPCAALATIRPDEAAWITAGALAPVVVLAIAAGSGRREIRAPDAGISS
jgi:Fuc2NAc and GlcNAc transferase